MRSQNRGIVRGKNTVCQMTHLHPNPICADYQTSVGQAGVELSNDLPQEPWLSFDMPEDGITLHQDAS